MGAMVPGQTLHASSGGRFQRARDKKLKQQPCKRRKRARDTMTMCVPALQDILEPAAVAEEAGAERVRCMQALRAAARSEVSARTKRRYSEISACLWDGDSDQ